LRPSTISLGIPCDRPLPKNAKVVIKYCVEVEGLSVYTQTYDIERLPAKLAKDADRAIELWVDGSPDTLRMVNVANWGTARVRADVAARD
jgi:hypothetical protein